MDELINELQQWAATRAKFADTAYGVQLTPMDACNLGGVVEEALRAINELRERLHE